ncbi:Cysteine-rich receptor-like protein kinase 26 [Bienertia sinuspersici]
MTPIMNSLVAWRNWLEGNPLNIMDKTMPLVNNAEVLRCINIGLLCVQHNIAHRPSMSLVVLMLNSHTITPPMPSRPAFLLDNNAKIDRSNSNVSLQVINDESANKVTISEVEAR